MCYTSDCAYVIIGLGNLKTLNKQQYNIWTSDNWFPNANWRRLASDLMTIKRNHNSEYLPIAFS